MKIDTININPKDVVLMFLPTSHIHPSEIDEYAEKQLEILKKAFECLVMVIPTVVESEISVDITVISGSLAHE